MPSKKKENEKLRLGLALAAIILLALVFFPQEFTTALYSIFVTEDTVFLDCDDVEGWTFSSNTQVTVDTSDYVEGDGSLGLQSLDASLAYLQAKYILPSTLQDWSTFQNFSLYGKSSDRAIDVVILAPDWENRLTYRVYVTPEWGYYSWQLSEMTPTGAPDLVKIIRIEFWMYAYSTSRWFKIDNIVAGVSLPVPPEQPTPETPVLSRLHTEGGYIKDASGNIVQLKGVGWQDLQISDRVGYKSAPSLPVEYVNTWGRILRYKELGINFFRVSIDLISRYGDPANHPSFKDNLDEVVQAAYEQNIYVLIAFHYGSSQYDSLMAELLANHDAHGWLGLCRDIADRYKDYANVVGYQIWAEPGWAGYTSDQYDLLCERWASFNLDSAKAIHEVDPAALVVVMSPGYYAKAWVADYYVDNPLAEPNIVYGYQHYLYDKYYSGWWQYYESGDYAAGKQKLEEYYTNLAYKMVSKGYPVMDCEFGFHANLQGLSVTVSGVEHKIASEAQLAQDYYDIQNKWKQSWIQFCWWSDASSPASWALVKSDWYTLTAAGELMVKNIGRGFSEVVSNPTNQKILLFALLSGCIALYALKRRI